MAKMKLYYSPSSPYARKVRVVAIETGLDKKIEMVNVALTPVAPNADVDKHNPIGKIPALSVKGMDLFDSPVICEYLDSQHKGRKLFPRKGRDRWMALRQQAMADGLLDAALLARYEGALRPEEKRWPDWSQGPDEEDQRRAGPARGRGRSRSRASSPSAPSRSPARWAISTCASPTWAGATSTPSSPSGSPPRRRCRRSSRPRRRRPDRPERDRRRDHRAASGCSRIPKAGITARCSARPTSPRGASTAIYFLLKAGERSHWHRVDADEIWHHYAGAPLELSLSDDGRSVRHLRVGIDFEIGELPQAVVPRGAWQAARSLGSWTLVGCTVAPAFGFEGFELAPPGWEPELWRARPSLESNASTSRVRRARRRR